jgi:hypothetical protein
MAVIKQLLLPEHRFIVIEAGQAHWEQLTGRMRAQ